MKRMTLSEYLAVPENYRGVWTTERWDIPDWENLRKSHMGKRTLMVYDRGTCLLVEGLSLEIVDDSSWKKPANKSCNSRPSIRQQYDLLQPKNLWQACCKKEASSRGTHPSFQAQ